MNTKLNYMNPAFPLNHVNEELLDDPEYEAYVSGLTKREWFAGLALGCLKEAPMDVTASRAVIIADALIKALDK